MKHTLDDSTYNHIDDIWIYIKVVEGVKT